MSELLEQVRTIWAPWAEWKVIKAWPRMDMPICFGDTEGNLLRGDMLPCIACAMLEEIKRKGLETELINGPKGWDCGIASWDEQGRYTTHVSIEGERRPQDAILKACIAYAKAQS